MDKEPDNPQKSSSEPDQQLGFPSGSFGMEDANLYASPSMEFGGFSSVYSATPVFEFRSDPPPSGGVGDEAEENTGVPQPLAGLHESPVPPFLSKTYDLVNDRNLDPIISWGSTGESFVVWDPVEFSRVVLPRNFKHNNFSSFVRQLNTYGFRKIDSDKWEFANEAFRRGKKHLLKNIQRRRTLQAQQTVSYTGPSTRAGMTELESEIETLRKERGEMMQEVVQLQQQQRGSVHHMEEVNQRLQAAEQRQKQMVSFLAKLFQNPSFIARLKQTKEQREIGSPRMKRKFIKHGAHEQGLLESAMEGQIVKYEPEWKSHLFSSEAMASEAQIENVPADEYAVSSELTAAQGFMNTPLQFGEGPSNLLREDPGFKGKSVMSPLQEVGLEYLVSSPMDLISEKDFPEFSPAGMESIVKQEDLWSMGFETQTGMLNRSQEMWSNIGNYDVTDLVSSGGLSDIWDLGSLQAGGSSGMQWPSTESPGNEPESHDGRTSPGK